MSGVRDRGLLESAVRRPQTHLFGIERYKSIHLKSASLLEAIALYHPFNDGNKRTAMAAAGFFLYLNGHGTTITNQEYEDFMLEVVHKKLSVKVISSWLEEHSSKL